MVEVVDCKACNGSRWIFNYGENSASKCPDCIPASVESSLLSTGIPNRYANSSIDQLIPSTDTESEALKAIAIIANFKEGMSFKTILIAGPPGVGKTHVLCSLVRSATTAGTKSKYWDFQHLCRTIRDRFMNGTTTIVSELCRCPMLALDNVGLGRGSDFERSVINEIACSRYDDGRPTVYATNYKPYSVNSPTGLGSRVGEHVYSRLISDHVLIFDGHDRRRHAR